jgi:hypothetical protein
MHPRLASPRYRPTFSALHRHRPTLSSATTMRLSMPRLHPLSRIAAITCAALLISACGDTTAPVPAANAPRELAYDMNALEGAGSTSERMDVGAVVVTNYDGRRTRRVRAVPTAAQWDAFWAAAEQAGVRQWTGDYNAEGFVDGSAWSLRLAGNGVDVSAHGTNAYPDREGREHEIHRPADFTAFLAALSTLTGWDF